jgi:hypothetical protein
MRMILSSALVSLAIALAGTTGASAAAGASLAQASKANSSLTQVQAVCRNVRVCRISPQQGHRRTCYWQQVCN